jgi:hypothetical protein
MVSIWLKVETNLQTHINWNETLGLCFWIRTYEAKFQAKKLHSKKKVKGFDWYLVWYRWTFGTLNFACQPCVPRQLPLLKQPNDKWCKIGITSMW